MSGGGVKLRTFTSVNLAWWHSFKHGVGSIWKAYANTIWAPLWQRLYPGTLFYAKEGAVATGRKYAPGVYAESLPRVPQTAERSPGES